MILAKEGDLVMYNLKQNQYFEIKNLIKEGIESPDILIILEENYTDCILRRNLD